MTLASVDIGTSSVLLLIVETSGGEIRVVEERGEVPRLGRGLDRSGRLDPVRAEAALATLHEYGRAAAARGARLRAVGTQALREAADAPAFLARARAALGATVEVVSPEREAALTLLAVTRSFPDLGAPPVALDIGGGSTEVAGARPDGGVAFWRSLPVGSVRTSERHLLAERPGEADLAAARAEVRAQLVAVPVPSPPAPLVGVAATVTTVAAVALGLARYDGARVHGTRVARSEVASQIDRYRSLRPEERARIPGVDPRRADVILGGAIVLDEAMAHLGAAEVIASDRGVRWGLIHEMIAGA